jgi:hypothetical protein
MRRTAYVPEEEIDKYGQNLAISLASSGMK